LERVQENLFFKKGFPEKPHFITRKDTAMLLSTQTDVVFAKCGIDEGLKIFAKAGYEALDYSSSA